MSDHDDGGSGGADATGAIRRQSGRRRPGAIVGAYCAAPPALESDPARERAWYAELATHDEISGLELPFAGGLHPAGARHLAALLAPEWRSVVSDIPGTAVAVRSDPEYGLASTSERGRAAALTDARRMHDEARRLGTAVIAVELHSAPTHGNKEELAGSLAEIASWDWGAITVCLEHADALTSGHPAEKGYLSLDDEVWAARTASDASGIPIMHSINWGRSAIEGRNARTPVRHIQTLRELHALGGVIISGVAGTGPEAWRDAHLGAADDDPASILGDAELHAATEALTDARLTFFGVKMRAPTWARPDTPLPRRLAPSLNALAALSNPTRPA